MAVALGKPWDWLGAAPPGDTPPGPGRRLAAARLSAGLSTQEVAALTGLPTRTVNQLERGLQPSAHRRTWRDLAAALHVSMEWLLNGEGPGTAMQWTPRRRVVIRAGSRGG